MYGWAPLAIMGEEINKLSPSSSSAASYTRRTSTEDPPALEMSSLMSDDPLALGHAEAESSSSPTSIKIPHRKDLNMDDDDAGMAGIYLGIHNIFATVPLFLATFVSMVVFSVLEPGQSPELAAGGGGAGASTSIDDTGGNVAGDGGVGTGLSGTAVCLAIGAVFQVVAAAQSLRMRRF